MTSDERRAQILEKAIELLAESAQSLNTRELAERLGVSHALLFKYFASKADILEAVFQSVYVNRFPDELRRQVQAASDDMPAKWSALYAVYAPRIFDRTWIRIFISTALRREPIASRYFELVVVPLVTRLAQDTEQHCLGKVQRANSALRAASLELAWTTHSAVFYSGLRRWVYELPVSDDIVATMKIKVIAHFAGARAVLCQGADLPDLRR